MENTFIIKPLTNREREYLPIVREYLDDLETNTGDDFSVLEFDEYNNQLTSLDCVLAKTGPSLTTVLALFDASFQEVPILRDTLNDFEVFLMKRLVAERIVRTMRN